LAISTEKLIILAFAKKELGRLRNTQMRTDASATEGSKMGPATEERVQTLDASTFPKNKIGDNPAFQYPVIKTVERPFFLAFHGLN
jgi:hypothetical protein